jgi:hypothetical protein
VGIIGIGELEPTEWVTKTLTGIGRQLRQHQLHTDASLAASLVVGKRTDVQVWGCGDWRRPKPGRLVPASDQHLTRLWRMGRMTGAMTEWSLEAINAVWIRFRYTSMPMVIVHDRSLFAIRMVTVFKDRPVIEVDWRRQQLLAHGQEGEHGGEIAVAPGELPE